MDRHTPQISPTCLDFRSVIPLAFHVTYWDQLGCDAFGQKAFDHRQRALARRENTGVYTSGMFLNGREWHDLTLHTAFLTKHASTSVHRGENRGRNLDEGSIVQAYRTFNMACPKNSRVRASLNAPSGTNILVAWLTDQKGSHVQASGTYF